MVDSSSTWFLFSGSCNEELSLELAKSIGHPLGKRVIETFPDGEIGLQILDNVRGKDLFLLQSIAKRPNHYLMELLIMIDACKRASAKSITAVVPYFGYARQDRKDKGRVPITAKLVANLLEKAGISRLLTMDLHTEQVQGFFDIPVDNLYARPLFVREIRKRGSGGVVIVAPYVGSSRMAKKFAEDLQVDLAIVDKRRVNAERVESGALIGDVKGKCVYLVDDICSTGGTLVMAAKACKHAGANSVSAFVTHNLLSEPGPLEAKELDELIVTNTVPSAIRHPKLKIITVAELFGQAIERVNSSQSISSLFKS